MKKIVLLVVVLACLVLSGCGYKLAGTSKSIPKHIQSVCVNDFENRTVRYRAESFLSDAIRKEFIQRSGLKLVAEQSKSDSVIEGEILRFEVAPAVITKDHAKVYSVKLTVNVRFIDKINQQLIYENKKLAVERTYDIQYGEFGSLEDETLKEISDEIAESVVVAILENF